MSEEQKPAGNEPVRKKRTPRNTKQKNELTIKEIALVKALLETNNVSEAGRRARYCDASESHKALKRVQRKMPDLLDAHGLTEEYVIEECLKPSLKATETLFYANKGIVLDQREVIAWGPRQQAEDRYWKLRGRLNGTRAEEGDNSGGRPAAPGHSLSLVFTDKGAAKEFVEAIAARRSASGLIDMDAQVDPNLGRARHREPVQANP